MADFTSSLYLDMRHPSRTIGGWPQLTTGKPAALEPPAHAAAIARALARLTGCDSAVLLPSTLHLFFDLFEMMRHDGISLHIDSGAYPIARWAAQRASALGVPMRAFRHFDAAAAWASVGVGAASGLRPVIVTDGFCPSCSRPAPLPEYLRCVAHAGGRLVIDDTQAVGIWGAHPTPRNPYGLGGGGSLRLRDIRSPRVVIGASLAKGFGAPVAVLAGNAALINRFERCSLTRVHASPPSAPVLQAAARAVSLNAAQGDELRRRLAALVHDFQSWIGATGVVAPQSLFPVQGLVAPHSADLGQLQRRLATQGVETVVVQGCDGRQDRLTFVLGLRHTPADLGRAAAALARALKMTPHLIAASDQDRKQAHSGFVAMKLSVRGPNASARARTIYAR
jgi:8-amino-7-oxononanoate synthase